MTVFKKFLQLPQLYSEHMSAVSSFRQLITLKEKYDK